jgi:hypothetical protein
MSQADSDTVMIAMLSWWHWPLALAFLWLGGIMVLCAYHWPRSPTSGVEFVRDILIPSSFALLAGIAFIAGFALMSAR